MKFSRNKRDVSHLIGEGGMGGKTEEEGRRGGEAKLVIRGYERSTKVSNMKL